MPVVSVGGGGGGVGAGAGSLFRSVDGGEGFDPLSVEAVAVSDAAVRVMSDDASARAAAVELAGVVVGRDRRIILIRSTGPEFAVAVPEGRVPAIDPIAVLVLPAVGVPNVKFVVVSTAVLVDELVAIVALPSPMLEVTVPLAPSCTTSYCCC